MNTFDFWSALAGHIIAIVALIISIITMTSANSITKQIEQIKKNVVRKTEFRKQQPYIIKTIEKQIKAIRSNVFGKFSLIESVTIIENIIHYYNDWDNADKSLIDDSLSHLQPYLNNEEKFEKDEKAISAKCLHTLINIKNIIDREDNLQ